MNYYEFDECPKWLKDVLRQTVKYICQECKKHEKEVGKLQINTKYINPLKLILI